MSDQLTVTAALRFTDRLSSDELAALMARREAAEEFPDEIDWEELPQL